MSKKPTAVIDRCPNVPYYKAIRAEFIDDADPRNDGTTNVYVTVRNAKGDPDDAQFVHQAWPQVPDHDIVLHPDKFTYTATLEGGGSNFDPDKEIGPQRFYVNGYAFSDIVRGIGLVGSHHDQWYVDFQLVTDENGEGGGGSGDPMTRADWHKVFQAMADATT